MRYYTLIYTRTASPSVRDQQPALDRQEAECRGYAARHQLAVNEVVREASGAYDHDRPRFEAILRDSAQRHEQGTQTRILCSSPDRLTRHLADWHRLDGLRAKGVELCFAHDGRYRRRGGLPVWWEPTLRNAPPAGPGEAPSDRSGRLGPLPEGEPRPPQQSSDQAAEQG